MKLFNKLFSLVILRCSAGILIVLLLTASQADGNFDKSNSYRCDFELEVNTKCTSTNNDRWSTKTIQSDATFSEGNFLYGDGENANEDLIDLYNWTISDGGLEPTCTSCDDGIQNGDETGIDCGGTNCVPCCTPEGEYAMNFDGVDNNIGDLDNIGMGTEFTVEFWINPAATQSQFSQPIGYTHTSFNSWTIQADGDSDTNWRFAAAHASSFYFVDFTLVSDTWQHVALTLDGTEMKVFIDGVEDGVTTRTTDINYTGTEVLDLGSWFNNSTSTYSRFFNGQLDEIRIWDHVRSDTEIIDSHTTSVNPNANGLLLYYECDDLIDGDLIDATPNANDGTLIDFDLPADIECGVELDDPCIDPGNFALDFDGVDDHITATGPSLSNWTIEAWVKPKTNTGYSTIYASLDNGFFLQDRKLVWWDDSAQRLSGTTILTEDVWTHIAITYDGTDLIAYIDGVEEATGTYASSSLAGVAQGIGGHDGVEYYEGSIDEIRIWDNARPQTEIAINMSNYLVGDETGLIAYYNFDDALGTTLSDLTASALDGTLQNMDNGDWVCSQVLSDPPNCPETREWTGAEDNLWSNPNNWCRGAIPSVGDDVLLPLSATNDPHVDINVNIYSLDIYKPLTILVGNTLEITDDGNLYNADVTNFGVMNVRNFGSATGGDSEFLNMTGASIILTLPGFPASAGISLREEKIINDGTILIQQPGSLNARGIVMDQNFTFPTPAAQFINNGTLTMDGLLNDGVYLNDGGIFINNGIYNVTNIGNAYAINTSTTGEEFTNNGTITIDGGNGIYCSVDVENTGTIDIQNVNSGFGAVFTVADHTFDNSGTINILNSTKNGFNFAGSTTVTNTGILNVANGLLSMVSATNPWTNAGTLQGQGLITGDMTNTGTLIPGQSPGIITYDDAFINTGEIEFEVVGLGGAGDVNGHDQLILNSTGNTIGGTISVTSTHSANPGDQFVLISATDGYAGTFATTNLPPNESGLSWVISYEATEVILSLGPICYAPSDLVVDNLSETTADISWTPGGNCALDGTYWVQSVQDPPPTIGVGGETFTCGGTFPISVSGLTAGEYYNVYVHESCGTGIDVGPELVGSFTTWIDCEPDGQFSLDFDGVNDDIQDLDNLGLTTEFSVEFWINPSLSQNSLAQPIGYSHGNFTSWTLQYDGPIWRFAVGNGAWNFIDFSLVAEEWQHISFIVTSTSVTLYVNGVELESIVLSSPIAFTGSEVLDLGSYLGSSRYFNGKLDELRIWDAALTQADILARLNMELIGNEPGLIAYYNFNDGNGSSLLTDQTTNNYDGTLTNMDPNSDWVCGFESIPCLQASGLSTTEIGGSSATANWATNGNPDFEVIIGETGFDFGDEEMSYTVTGSSVIMTGLEDGKTYDWYVRADCDADGFSNYAGPQTFIINNTSLLFSDNSDFVTHLVSPQVGIPEDTYRFEIIYENQLGELPSTSFPRVLLDQDNDGTPELIIAMNEMDASDTDVTDGKYYFAEIAGLQPSSDYTVTIEDIKTGGAHTVIGPLDQPDILLNPNLQLFASDISFSEPNPDVDEYFNVYADIHNVGSFDLTDVDVQLYNQMTETIEGTVTIDLISVGETVNVFWDVQAADEDAWVPYKVTIDPLDNILESNELDNDAVKAVIVGDFTLPIDIDFLSGPSISPYSAAIYETRDLIGNAVYTGLNGTTQDTTVKGAQVLITIDVSGESFIGYTNNQGDFDIPIETGLGVGTYACTGVISDETITKVFTLNFLVTAPPPSCVLPDLELKGTVDNSVVNIGELVSGTFTVTNLGCSATTDTVSITTNFPGAETAVGPWEILPLDIGQDTVLIWSTSYNTESSVSISAHVDDELEVVELDEGNNYYSNSSINIASQSNLKLSGSTCSVVTISPDNPVPGTTATLNFVIQNDALLTLEDSYDVDLDVNGTLFTETFDDDIPAGGSYLASIDFTVPPIGDNDMTITLDPDDNVDETDETDNIFQDKLCTDFSLTAACGSPLDVPFWEETQAVNQVIDLSIGVHNNGHYKADDVSVTFEVMGPGYPTWTLIDTEIISFAGKTCGCPLKVTSSVLFSLSTEGSYQIRMTADADGDFIECDESDNVLIVDLEIANIPDMQTISAYVNPSELNPDIDEQISFIVTYENIGDENIADEFDLQLAVDGVVVETVTVDGLITNGEASVAITNQWSSSDLGGHIISAFVDSGEEITEISETNNEATRSIIVGTAPNLRFLTFNVSDTVPELGDPILIQSLIENQGDASCAANLEIYYLDYDGTEVLVESIPISVDAMTTAQYSVSYTVDRDEVYLIAKITPGTPTEYNLLDNEDQLLLKTGVPQCNLIVTNTNDDGEGSLRQCIECANAEENEDQIISFDIPGAGPHEINLLSELPNLLADSVIIDGTTQEGNYPMIGDVILDITAVPDYNKVCWRIHGSNTEVYGLSFQNLDLTSVTTALYYATTADSLVIGDSARGNWFKEDKWTSSIFLKENINKGVIQSNIFKSDSLRLKFGITINSGSNRIIVGGEKPWQANEFHNLSGNAVEIRNGSNDNRILNNLFVENNLAIYSNADIYGNGATNKGNYYLGNTFICNTESISHHVNSNLGMSPPTITHSKINYIAGIGDPGAIVEIYGSPDTCLLADCQGDTILLRDTLDLDGAFHLTLDSNHLLDIGYNISAIQTDLVKGSSIFTNCEIVDNDCVDFVYTCDDNIVGSLRSAVDCAAEGSTIYFLDYLSDDLLDVTDGICIDKNLVIEGLGNPGLTLLSNAEDFVIKISGGKIVTIQDLILCTNDTAANPLIDNLGNLILDNVTINDKRTGAAQDVIVNKVSGTLEVKNKVELLKE